MKMTVKQTMNPAKSDLLTLAQKVLVPLGLLLLVIGFAGPWVYGPLGKTTDWGWQPIWGLLLSFISLNLFILISLASCFSYVEFYYRRGLPVLSALLKWIAGFFGLVVVLPLVVWLAFDLTQRSAVAQQPDGAFGWGLWVALVGQILQVAGVRLKIWQLSQTNPTNLSSGTSEASGEN